MAKHLLNDIPLRAIKPTSKDQLISDGGGLYILVKPDGKKWRRFVYTFDTKRKALSLGVYPQISLSVARKQAESNRIIIANGVNPSDLRKQKKIQNSVKIEAKQRIADGLPPLGSFQFVAEEWFSKRMSDKLFAHTKRVLALLINDVFPWIGHRPINEITPPDLLDV